MKWFRPFRRDLATDKGERAEDQRAIRALGVAAGVARERIDRIVRDYQRAEELRLKLSQKEEEE